jgi:hypothetical protein
VQGRLTKDEFDHRVGSLHRGRPLARPEMHPAPGISRPRRTTPVGRPRSSAQCGSCTRPTTPAAIPVTRSK